MWVPRSSLRIIQDKIDFLKPPCEVSSHIIYGLGLAHEPVACQWFFSIMHVKGEYPFGNKQKHMSEEGPGVDLDYFGDGHIFIPRYV